MKHGGRLRALLSGTQVRRIGSISIGTALGQLSLLLASPILARLYTPESFGIYSYYFAIIGFLAPVAALRYDLAIPLPTSERRAGETLAVALLSSLVMGGGILVLGVIALLSGALPPGELGFIWIVLAVPAAIVASGSYQALMYWGVRVGAFRRIGGSRGIMGSGIGVGQLGFGVAGFGAPGLVSGDLFGRALASLSLLRLALPALRRTTVRRLRRTAARFRGFALLSSPAALINSTTLSIPLVLVGALHGAAAAGLLFMAQRFIGLPTALLSTSASQVFLAELASSGHGTRRKLYRRAVSRLAVLGVPCFALGALSAPVVFPVLLGEVWAASGWIALLLSPYYLVQLLSGGTISGLDFLQEHRLRLIREVVFLCIVLAAFGAGFFWNLSLYQLIAIYSASGATFYIGSIVWVDHIVSETG